MGALLEVDRIDDSLIILCEATSAKLLEDRWEARSRRKFRQLVDLIKRPACGRRQRKIVLPVPALWLHKILRKVS
jgi:hypothetical protein